MSHVESTKLPDVDKEQSSRSADLQVEVDRLRQQLVDRDSRIMTLEDVRLSLEKQLRCQVAEISVCVYM